MKHTEENAYPLISSQQMVEFMWKYAVHKQATQIPCAVVFDEPLDLSVLARAVNTEIERNDCLRLRFIKKGGRIRQYVLPEYRLEKIRVLKFSSAAEQEAALDAVSCKALKVFQGETFKVLFFYTPDGRTGIYLIVSHVIMDAMATFAFFKDLLSVYDALKAGEALPKPLGSYEALIKKELSDETHPARVAAQSAELDAWFAADGPPTYCTAAGTPPDRPARSGRHGPGPIRPRDYFPLFDRAAFTKCALSAENSREIEAYVRENEISAEWVIQLGLRTYLSKINHAPNDTVFWVLCPRRRTVTEKRSGGTLASPMPWRARLDGETTFTAAVRQLAAEQGFLFRHADVPFTALRKSEQKLFGYTPLQTANSMMFSYLPLGPDAFDGRGYEFLGFPMGYYVMPLYTIALYDAKSGCYKINYVHRTHSYTEAQIRSFHAGVVRTILAGVRNPQKTLNEIKEES